MTKYLIAGLFTALISATTQAQNSIGYYQVAILDDGDHLNVRAEPTAESEDVGNLLSGAKPFEILEIDSSGKWGRISWQEDTAWVALQFMRPLQVELIADTTVPVGLTCVGTEPFWTIELTSQQSALMTTPQSTIDLSVGSAAVTRNRSEYPVAVELHGADYSAVAVLRREQCADGITDITYNWATDIIIQPGLTVFSGCCILR